MMIALAGLGSGWSSTAVAAPAREARSATKPDRASLTAILRENAGGAVRKFYAERGFRPLWIAANRVGPSASKLLGYLETADRDGLKPSRYDIDKIRHAIDTARNGDPKALAEAELRLSNAFARYVQDQRRVRRDRTDYADARLKPVRLQPEMILRAAAFPKSLADYVTGMEWMSPAYVLLRTLAGQLEKGQAEKGGASRQDMERLHRNMDRARLLPGPWTRHVEVDASSGRLWFYEAGRQVGTMRVVVGAKETQTPIMAGMLQWAIVNPYWNVPDYLVRQNVAPKILSGRTLASMKMEALSDWSESAVRLDPATIDWSAVAAGKLDLRVRELPGAANSMGRVKFLFPNDEGIYLHDTPVRALLEKPDRHFSNGCIRLENAAELGRWLLQKALPTASRQPEQALALPVPVPVYLTYITAMAGEGGGIAFRDDVYGRDE